jgi:hypothetical protein
VKSKPENHSNSIGCKQLEQQTNQMRFFIKSQEEEEEEAPDMG